MNNYLIISESISLVNQKINALINEKGFLKEMVTYYDLEEVDLANLLEDVNTISFLTPKKVVIGRNFKFFSKEDSQKLEKLIKYLDNSLENVLLILTTTRLDERLKITKEIMKKITVLKLEVNSKDIIKEKFKDYKIDQKTINLLDLYYQDDLERLIRECDKLKLCFIEDKNIIYEKAKELLLKPTNNQDNLSFDLTRAIALKNKKEAINIYKELLDYNIESYTIIGLLESQYRLLYQVKILARDHLSNYDMSKLLDVHPFRVKKTLELISYYSEKEIVKVIRNLAKLDFNIKSGMVDSTMVLDLLLLNINNF